MASDSMEITDQKMYKLYRSKQSPKINEFHRRGSTEYNGSPEKEKRTYSVPDAGTDANSGWGLTDEVFFFTI